MTNTEKLKALHEMVKKLNDRVRYLSFYIPKGKATDKKFSDEIKDIDKTME